VREVEVMLIRSLLSTFWQTRGDDHASARGAMRAIGMVWRNRITRPASYRSWRLALIC